MSRLDLMKALNPEFAEALARGESWATEHAQAVNELDNPSRRHPERTRKEDRKNGVTRRNWCGSCPSKKGCVMCDLDGDHEGMKGMVGVWDD